MRNPGQNLVIDITKLKISRKVISGSLPVMNQNKKPHKNIGYKYFVSKKDVSQSNATSPMCQSEASSILANQNTEK